MKKKIGIIVLIVGGLATLVGAISLLNYISSAASNISIGGGADGPTAIFFAGKIGYPMYGAVIGGVILVVIGVLLVKKQKE